MLWIVAGIAATGTIAGAASGSAADREAADIEKFQGRIDVGRFKGDAAVLTYNMSRDLSILESEQIAMSAAMGKQAGVGSVANIQEVGRKDTERNIERIEKDVARAVKFGQVSEGAIDRTTAARTKQRTIQAGTRGLLSFAKASA